MLGAVKLGVEEERSVPLSMGNGTLFRQRGKSIKSGPKHAAGLHSMRNRALIILINSIWIIVTTLTPAQGSLSKKR